MDVFFGFLSFALFVAMIVGLIKPSLVMFWSKNPKRIKVFGWWVLSTIFLFALSILLENDKSKFKSAQDKIAKQEYSSAISTLETINKESDYFYAADSLKKQAEAMFKAYNDSITTVKVQKEETQRLADLEIQKAKNQEEREQQAEQLRREIKSIDNGVDFSTYRETVDAMQIEIILFGTWSTIIKDGLLSDDPEVQRLANKLKSKVVRLQTKQFPILRKEYAKVVSNTMWEHDIKVSANGTGYCYINFSGGFFAANKNKKDFQGQLNEALTMFRFTQSRYRWYEGEEEYTYWEVYKGEDSDLVSFNK